MLADFLRAGQLRAERGGASATGNPLGNPTRLDGCQFVLLKSDKDLWLGRDPLFDFTALHISISRFKCVIRRTKMVIGPVLMHGMKLWLGKSALMQSLNFS